MKLALETLSESAVRIFLDWYFLIWFGVALALAIVGGNMADSTGFAYFLSQTMIVLSFIGFGSLGVALMAWAID